MENILLKEAIIMANSNNMCRLCLSANGITEPLCYDQRDQFLLQKIYECTTLQIAPLNGIPSSLCTICKARLDEFYQFRWQCIKNDEIIRRIADNFQQQKQQAPPPPTSDPPTTDPHTNHGTTPPVPVAVAGSAEHHHVVANPKQEIIEPATAPPPQVVLANGELQITPVDGGAAQYNPVEGRRSVERDMYRHPEHVDQPGYGIDHHHHHAQYGMGPSGGGEEFSAEIKYHHAAHGHSYEFADFRRKRGRPPKQKYDQYHHHPPPHPIVKYGESSTDSKEDGSGSSSTAMLDEPETMLSYGEGSSRVGGEYQQPYGAWPPQTKIKLEHMEQQQPQPPGHYEGQMSPVPVDGRLPVTNTTQTLLTPEGFVKRSRGRPPREGGCPNQDRTEYRFQCQFCDARFKAAINLKLHTNTHTGERPYKCQLCDKSFAHPSNLSVHTKLHTQERVKREGQGATPSEKKFQCPFCHTLFALAFQLKIHINTHTGQKPYVCKNCGKGFAQPSNLHVHVKKHCHKRMESVQVPLQHHPEQQQQQQHYQPLPVQQQIVPMPAQQANSPEGGQQELSLPLPLPPPQQQQQQQDQLHSPPPEAAQSTHSIGGMPPVMMA